MMASGHHFSYYHRTREPSLSSSSSFIIQVSAASSVLESECDLFASSARLLRPHSAACRGHAHSPGRPARASQRRVADLNSLDFFLNSLARAPETTGSLPARASAKRPASKWMRPRRGPCEELRILLCDCSAAELKLIPIDRSRPLARSLVGQTRTAQWPSSSPSSPPPPPRPKGAHNGRASLPAARRRWRQR